MVEDLKDKVIRGEHINIEEALYLGTKSYKEELYNASREITQKMASKTFEICSVINAKNGECSENCAWCEQSSYYETGSEAYNLIDKLTCYKSAYHNELQGIKRFSILTSGKKPNKNQLEKICELSKYLKTRTNIKLCASLGLLGEKGLSELQKSGIERYHCNLESSPSHFPFLCSTHTISQKINTLKLAKKIGMEICSGGIIGMGENLEQRIELALALRELELESIPINLLQPIIGTPLENQQILTDSEILTTIALFRFINPKAYLRFAGGKSQISKEIIEKSLYVGINSLVVGGTPTTLVSNIKEKKKMIRKSGYNL